MSKKWLECGTIRTGDRGLYIKLHGKKMSDGSVDVSGLERLMDSINDNKNEKGLSLMIEKPEDQILRLAELGYIEEKDIEDRLSSIPAWKKYIIKIGPSS
ncbi:MAG: hypothetical protein R3321_14750 [Nitrososphaeraceae archaeon]|nr:hypothetical protein [Nitrososphaeraceae archaeon]